MPKIKPNSVQMTHSISTVGIRVIKDTLHRRGSIVSDDIYHERMKICKSCTQYRKDGRCAECGCVMRLKTKFRVTSCSIGKWSSEKVQNI